MNDQHHHQAHMCPPPHHGATTPSVARAPPQHSHWRCPRLRAGSVRGEQRSATAFAGNKHNRGARPQRQLSQLPTARSRSRRCPALTRWCCGAAAAAACRVGGCAWVAAATQVCGVVECAWRVENVGLGCPDQASRSPCPHTPPEDHTKRCCRLLRRAEMTVTAVATPGPRRTLREALSWRDIHQHSARVMPNERASGAGAGSLANTALAPLAAAACS